MSAYDHKGDWPAYPVPLNPGEAYKGHAPCDGMTLRQYAAIKLRVPDSGTDWLDDMIRQSLRDELAGKALNALIGDSFYQSEGAAIGWGEIGPEISIEAYGLADAMLEARGKS